MQKSAVMGLRSAPARVPQQNPCLASPRRPILRQSVRQRPVRLLQVPAEAAGATSQPHGMPAVGTAKHSAK